MATTATGTWAISSMVSTRALSRPYRSSSPLAARPSYSRASNAPDCSVPPSPHSTKPAANPQNDGNSTQAVYPKACSTPETTSEPRRENRSASAPDGTSKTTAVSDQIASSTEIWASDSPLSAKSNAYSA